jgi:hypothetical protein
MNNPLEARLAELAALQQTISYGQLAKDLAIPGPGSISKLTAALETLMEADAATNRPFRAALCAARLGNDLPAQGFFDKATALGRFKDADPTAFVQAERRALWSQTVSQKQP